MNILMTTFEPFGKTKVNSSLIALNNLQYNKIIKVVLPVKYHDSFKILKEHLNDIDLIIMLGMAESRDKIFIEERAINLLNFKIPNNNNIIITNQLISESNKEFLYIKISINNLLNHLNDLNIIESNDARKYICNYLYYKVLEEINIPSLFIHIPLYQTNDEFKNLNNTLIKILDYLGGKDEKNH